MLVFENVATNHGSILRAKVPGGWLVMVENDNRDGWQNSITFVPDPEHTWEV